MSFYQLFIKMLRNDFSKYRLFFWCCCVSAAVFFCFASLLFNEQFMDGYTVDSMISSNLIFPGILTAVCMLLLIPLSYRMFWNARKQDYGIFLSLGMSRREAVKSLALESVCVLTAALFAAFFMGVVCCGAFCGILTFGLHIRGWKWGIPAEAFVWTLVLYGAAAGLTVVVFALCLLWAKIGGMLKNHEKPEAYGVCYHVLQKYMPRFLNRNLVRFSFLMRHKREWCFRHAAAGVVVMAVVCLASLSVCLFGGFERDVELYAPFDLAYVSLYGYNELSNEEAGELLGRENAEVTDSCQIGFYRDAAFNYVSASDLNHKLHTNYAPEKGTFINLFQFAGDDGYEHDMTLVDSVGISGPEGPVPLVSGGSDVRILWNRNPAFADRTLILNDADFALLSGSADCWQGTIHLFSLADWAHSKGAVTALADFLRQENGCGQETQRLLAVTSRISDFERAQQSGGVLVLSVSVAVLLLGAAAFSFIHFRIAGEREERGRSVKSLRLIGCSGSELRSMILFKNRVHFTLPVIMGGVFGMLPSYALNQTYRFGLRSMLLCLVFCAVLYAVVWKTAVGYSRREFASLGERRA